MLQLGDILIDAGLVSAGQLAEAVEEQEQTGRPLGRLLNDHGVLTEAQLVGALATQIGLPFVDLTEFPVDGSAVSLLSAAACRRHNAIAIGYEDGRLMVAMADPADVFAVDDIRSLTGMEVKPVVATRDDVLQAINRFHRADLGLEDMTIGLDDHEAADDLSQIRAVTEDAPIVKFVDVLITQAIQDRASDIHIEPAERDLRVRFRIDGVLHEIMRSPKSIQSGVVSRLKIMADINIAERRIPQDGRLSVVARTGSAPVTGAAVQFNLPSQAVTASGTSAPQDGGSCAWYGFGTTATINASGTVSAGLPDAPANVAAGTPPNVLTGDIQANGAAPCGGLSYDNLVAGGLARTAADPIGFEMGAAPYVKAPDVAGSGALIAGSGYVTSNALTSVPQQTRSGAAATMDSSATVVLFPNNPESGGLGLVSARLTSASVDCVSGVGAANGTVVAKYTLRLGWWGKGAADAVAKWHTATWTYDSSTGATPVRVGDVWDPATTVLGNGTLLSTVISAPTAPSVVSTGATTGLRGFASGVFTLTSASTLTNEAGAGFSAISVQLGQLTCVADDRR